MKSEEQREKERAWAKQCYNKMSELLIREIKGKNSTPAHTMQVLVRLLVGTTIAIVGYEKAPEAMSDLINMHLETYRNKQKEEQ